MTQGTLILPANDRYKSISLCSGVLSNSNGEFSIFKRNAIEQLLNENPDDDIVISMGTSKKGRKLLYVRPIPPLAKKAEGATEEEATEVGTPV